MKLPKLQLPKRKDPEPRRPMGQDPSRSYWTGSYFGDIAERFRHRGERIRIDLWEKREIVGGKWGDYYDRDDRWTEASSDELHEMGYLPAVRMPGYDSIQWWRQRVYVRLLNYQQYDIHAKNEAGEYLYSQDTPSTLHDEMMSTATKDFMKEMFRKTLPTMDVQKIIMIAILGAGAVLGLMMMGII